ncbi:MAG: hypothetical protein GX416_00485 [Bacteroidales bacterium]|nr:hypothetical protein [Bacteroidales bacterium]
MSELKSILISIICSFVFIQCQAETNKSESKSTIILSDTIRNNKLQKTKVEHLLIGKWFTPHAADINITFNKDRTFIFNSFNIKTQEIEVLRGKFELDGKNLILKYDNKPQQIFKFEKGKGVDDNYYITKGKKYYFVKSDL